MGFTGKQVADMFAVMEECKAKGDTHPDPTTGDYDRGNQTTVKFATDELNEVCSDAVQSEMGPYTTSVNVCFKVVSLPKGKGELKVACVGASVFEHHFGQVLKEVDFERLTEDMKDVLLTLALLT